MNSEPRQLEGRRVTVMGLGLFGGGAAVARFLASRGARVTITDLRTEAELAPALSSLVDIDARFVLGRHDEADFSSSDLIVVNPAVPPTSRFLELARNSETELTSEIALFLESTPARVVAVTGTQGKSSTTNYLAQLLSATHELGRVYLGGNIGRSLLADLDHMTADDLCAVELSSYQLERLPEDLRSDRERSPIEVALVTNVLSDHLERHKTREAYARAKLRILEVLAPRGVALLPAEDLPGEFEPPRDVRVSSHPGKQFVRSESGYEFAGELLATRDHDARFVAFQRDNLHLALAAARAMGAPLEGLNSAIATLRGLSHRLDLVGQLAGRRLWDNAVSTTPDSTLSAVEALPAGSTVMLGGKVKDIDLAPLISGLREREAHVVIFGAACDQWPQRFRDEGLAVHEASGACEALEVALGIGTGDLLFSPACSSFDAYPNFQARADEFLRAARRAGLASTEESLA